MTGPLRQDRPRTAARGEDIGDVLASIRKLIAQDAPGGQVGEAAAPVALTDPGIASPRIAGDLPLSPARTATLTNSLAEAVDAAAARMADTARRVEAARAAAPEAPEAPFRLNPDALIPAAAPRHPPEPRLRLSPQLAVVGGMDEGAEAEPGAGLASQDALAPAVGADARDLLVPTGGGVVGAPPSADVEDGLAALPSVDAEIATPTVAAPSELDAPFTVVAGGAQGLAQVVLAEGQSAPGVATPAPPAAAPVATAAQIAPAGARPAPVAAVLLDAGLAAAAPVIAPDARSAASAGPSAATPFAAAKPAASAASRLAAAGALASADARPAAALGTDRLGAAAPAVSSRAEPASSPVVAEIPTPAALAATHASAPAQATASVPVPHGPTPSPALTARTHLSAAPVSTALHEPVETLALDQADAEPDLADAAPHPDHSTLTEQLMDAHPLRNLLREAIRDELRGELGQRLDGDLRRMVREELAAALTEAFGQAAR